MARKLRIAASVFFGLLTLALVALWIRSYWWVDWLEAQRNGMYAAITSANGAIRIDRDSVDVSSPFSRLSSVRLDDPTTHGWPNHTLKFAWNLPEALIVVPHWFVGTITVTIATWAATGWNGRFSLRTLLIATTLLAVVLGLGVWLIR
jgi:hypothetical protein